MKYTQKAEEALAITSRLDREFSERTIIVTAVGTLLAILNTYRFYGAQVTGDNFENTLSRAEEMKR